MFYNNTFDHNEKNNLSLNRKVKFDNNFNKPEKNGLSSYNKGYTNKQDKTINFNSYEKPASGLGNLFQSCKNFSGTPNLFQSYNSAQPNLTDRLST